jgi:uncharacterized damage-inducible protein DinB
LRQTPLEVATLLDGLSEENLNRSPEDGGWSVRNILSHMRDAQGVLYYRMNLMLEQDNPILESKAVFEWARREEDRPVSTREVFETYKTSREETIQRLESIALVDWWRTGRHEEFGSLTLGQQVSYFALHEITHLPQIESLRKRLVETHSFYI